MEKSQDSCNFCAHHVLFRPIAPEPPLAQQTLSYFTHPPLILASVSSCGSLPLSSTCPRRTDFSELSQSVSAPCPHPPHPSVPPHGHHNGLQQHIAFIFAESPPPALTALPTPTSTHLHGDERHDDDEHADNGQRGGWGREGQR